MSLFGRGIVLVCVALVFMGLSVAYAGESADSATNDHEQFSPVPKTTTVRFATTAAENTVPKRFRQSAHTFSSTARFKRMSGPVRVFDVTFPSPVKTDVAENNTVYGNYFQPTGNGTHPACVVLHILGGDFALSQMIANSLARQGVAALFIKMPYYGQRRGKHSKRRMISREPAETVESMTQAVLDIRRAAAWLANRPEIDSGRLGVTGISLGGIMSALSAAAEPRFGKVAIYLGGGDLAPMVWKHPHQDAETFRRQWISGGGTRESFLKILKPVDPVTYGHLLKNRDVLMVAAKHDEIVPPECTLALWQSIGKKPKLIWLDAGHISAAQYIFAEVERMGRFFNSTRPATSSPKTAGPRTDSK